jgi:RNA polymerase sigma factor (sigma-70 family)
VGTEAKTIGCPLPSRTPGNQRAIRVVLPEVASGGNGGHLESGDLIARAKRGDHNAYALLVEQHQALAFRTAYLICGNAADAEEAAQEAFVKAYYHLARFRSDAPFRPWLLTIVANEARNRRRAGARRAGLVLRASGLQTADAADPSPEAAVLAQEERALLLAALDRLRPEEGLAVACRYFLELSEAEMAATLGCARGTVKSRLSRALGHLRQIIGDSNVKQGHLEAPHG